MSNSNPTALDPSEFDYAIVVKKKVDTKKITHELEKRSLIWVKTPIEGEDSLELICVRASSFDVLLKTAERIELPKQKVDNDLRYAGRKMPFIKQKGESFQGWNQAKEALKNPNSFGEFFTVAERHEIVFRILQGIEKGEEDIEEIEGTESIFPIHDSKKLNQLWKNWKMSAINYSIDDIQSYFGAHTTYYFAFMRTYMRLLLFPSMFGVIFFFLGDVNSSSIVPLYSLAAIVWASFFLKSWERQELTKANDWGYLYFEKEEEDIRAKFWGEIRKSPITEKDEIYFPARKRRLRQFISSLAMTAMLSIAVGFMFLSLNLQGYVKSDSFFYVEPLNGWVDPNGWFTIIPTIIHSIVIYLINQFVYRKLAEHLTEFENYKTLSAFENALLFKRVIIEFFDCYLPLFYVCFHGQNLYQLRMELIGLFIGDILRRVFTETILPLFLQSATKKIKKTKVKVEKPKTGYYPSDDYFKDEYENFDDFLEIVVQFGYIVLFAGAFPEASVVALISNIVEVKSDSFKICFLCRKPPSLRAASIGGWKSVMRVFAAVAVMTNCYMFGFSSDQLSHIFPQFAWKAGQARYILMIVFALEHMMFGLQIYIDWVISSEPKNVRILKARDVYLAKHPEN